jgi:hypothetical protein
LEAAFPKLVMISDFFSLVNCILIESFAFFEAQI